MEALIHLDTHVVVWLYLPRLDLLSVGATNLLESDELAVSPVVWLEVTYLHEIGRLTVDGPTMMASLENQIGLRTDPTPFVQVVAESHALSWTRDPFDRLIAANAIAANATLLTRDQQLLAKLPQATW